MRSAFLIALFLLSLVFALSRGRAVAGTSRCPVTDFSAARIVTDPECTWFRLESKETDWPKTTMPAAGHMALVSTADMRSVIWVRTQIDANTKPDAAGLIVFRDGKQLARYSIETLSQDAAWLKGLKQSTSWLLNRRALTVPSGLRFRIYTQNFQKLLFDTVSGELIDRSGPANECPVIVRGLVESAADGAWRVQIGSTLKGSLEKGSIDFASGDPGMKIGQAFLCLTNASGVWRGTRVARFYDACTPGLGYPEITKCIDHADLARIE